jgi:hypothetical protein
MADMQGDRFADGERLIIDGVLAAEQDRMTLEWVNAVQAVVRDLE